MDIIIRKGNPHGKRRSEIEQELQKEGWGASLTEEQIDKARFLERKIKETHGADKSFIRKDLVDKVN